MRFSLLLAPIGVVFGGTSDDPSDLSECKYSLEILQLQDGSTSFAGEINNMATFMTELTEDLRGIYGEFKFGLSSFVDKPIPLRGYGEYGNWDFAVDYCYREHSPLTEDNQEIISGLKELSGNLGSGNDFPENPMEALIFGAGDESVGWSPTNKTHSDSGRPIVRMLMLITDDIPHFPTDADDAIARFWNWPRSYPDPNNPKISIGGFGAHSFHDITGMVTVNVQSDKDLNDYLEMADLFAIFDLEGDLSSQQANRLDELITKFGPYPYPDVHAHPGDNSITDCRRTEYPSLEAVSKYLKARHMNLIFLVAEPPAYAAEMTKACKAIGMSAGTDCLVKLYTKYAEQMGIAAVVASIDGENTKDRILESIVAMTDMICLTPTTTTEAPTSTVTTTATEPATTSTEAPTTTSTEARTTTSTPETVTSLPPPPLTTQEQVLPPVATEEPTSAAAPQTTTTTSHTLKESSPQEKPSTTTSITTAEDTTSTSTEGAIIVPPPPPPSGGGSEGPNIGVITGAAVGGAAAVVVAGALYAKFGGGLFGGGSSAAAPGVTQVETPENPVERETVEEVTMDMFR